MGETLAETRLEIDAKKAELERTSAQLREALDVKRLVKENPLPIIAIGATGAFLIAGGPQKLAAHRADAASSRRASRRPTTPCRSRCSPGSITWPDAVGPRAEEARDTLAAELAAWRSNPRKNGKISKKLAKQIAEGPPGPSRTAWTAAEAVATVVLTAIARKAVMRVISGQPEDQTPAFHIGARLPLSRGRAGRRPRRRRARPASPRSPARRRPPRTTRRATSPMAIRP